MSDLDPDTFNRVMDDMCDQWAEMIERHKVEAGHAR
jgi:hypothetical protein